MALLFDGLLAVGQETLDVVVVVTGPQSQSPAQVPRLLHLVSHLFFLRWFGPVHEKSG